MTRGLLWLPLLILFIGLAWAGWNEYQKVESYQAWATQFERAKYDIYAALGQAGDRLTWGVPTRRGPIELQTVMLSQINRLELQVKAQPQPLDQPLAVTGAATITLWDQGGSTYQIRFTDAAIAYDWACFLAPRCANDVPTA